MYLVRQSLVEPGTQQQLAVLHTALAEVHTINWDGRMCYTLGRCTCGSGFQSGASFWIVKIYFHYRNWYNLRDHKSAVMGLEIHVEELVIHTFLEYA